MKVSQKICYGFLFFFNVGQAYLDPEAAAISSQIEREKKLSQSQPFYFRKQPFAKYTAKWQRRLLAFSNSQLNEFFSKYYTPLTKKTSLLLQPQQSFQLGLSQLAIFLGWASNFLVMFWLRGLGLLYNITVYITM